MTDSEDATKRKGEPMPFAKILAVCTGGKGDEETLRSAAALANTWGANVCVLSVMEPPSEIDMIADLTNVTRSEIESRLAKEHREEIAALVARAAPSLVPAIDIRIGKPFVEIIRHVVSEDMDLVIKSAEELRGVHGYLFASTDQHLMRKCPCPVWLRLGDSPAAAKTILAAVDVGEAMASEPETLKGLNRRIMETALNMAMVEGASVHVLHAWDAPGEGLVRMWSTAVDGNQAAETYVGEIEATHWRALNSLVDETRASMGSASQGPVVLQAHMERGDARDVIAEQAQKLKADVLIMGTIARTGVPGFIIGNTAEDILNNVNCSVITVKPQDYVSPIDTHKASTDA